MNNFRIVIDTNVVISALIFGSSSSMKAFTLAKLRGTILISNDVLSELINVLSRSKFDRYITSEIREDFLAGLMLEAEIVPITEKITACRDPKDNKFLELAISSYADYLLTGDQDLLVLHPFRNLQIITVSNFLNYFDNK
ncbi:MAG: putative toxin-antitoxin system toxin component, PIN family [Snowella sp.]|jgi:putative PIN family toxin of toxin-antitoxin system|nr:MAG: putative toxin-antitoxin system toxin component, PIN family [Snowella sp.]